jgi:drug/metabolite transporter (DMT)-like permease
VSAVLFALLAAMLLGTLPLLIRRGLQLAPERAMAALYQNGIAFLICAAVAAAIHDFSGNPVPFLLIGLLVPGLMQLLFVWSVSLAGPARVSVLMNTSPLLSVVIAWVVLGEPFHPDLLVGCVLIILGSLALVTERKRPEHVRVAGLVLAAGIAVCFAARDNLVRHYAEGTEVRPILAAALVLGAGTAFSIVAVAAERPEDAARRLRRAAAAYWPVGAALGAAYLCSFEAYYRGRISVVAPLIGTAAFFTVALSALLLRRIEGIGSHVLAGALLVVSGGALIAVFR